ncbi:TPA: hypothetical protein PXP39_001944 [Yersinia enterocolitica]|nr:hypothetical protein [Yersinia enterocolitica]HDL7832081.1 hypothetical protein [Yersinia enterocolitica]HDL7872745.1 hypothetical protein [Yersinia enterocolitica]HDL7885588.1 hypothetical protein [Yersinia enterocolitica]HDL7894054.1 hypothetical protein [Yersinia enterocolitica]
MWWFKPLLLIACLSGAVHSTQASLLSSTDNLLLLTIKQRISQFYRAVELPNTLANAYKTLTFSRHGNQLQVNNPSAYRISFHSLKIGGNEIKNVTMIAAKSTLTLPLPAGNSDSVSWQAISDFGGISPVASTTITDNRQLRAEL